MGISQTTMERVTVDQAVQSFSQLLRRVGRSAARVIVEEDGVPVAAIVSVDDLARLDQLEQERAARFAGLSRISEAFADVPVEELEREVARAVEAGRAAARRERTKAATQR